MSCPSGCLLQEHPAGWDHHLGRRYYIVVREMQIPEEGTSPRCFFTVFVLHVALRHQLSWVFFFFSISLVSTLIWRHSLTLGWVTQHTRRLFLKKKKGSRVLFFLFLMLLFFFSTPCGVGHTKQSESATCHKGTSRRADLQFQRPPF